MRQEVVDPDALFWQEAGGILVLLRVAQVDLPVSGVEIAA